MFQLLQLYEDITLWQDFVLCFNCFSYTKILPYGRTLFYASTALVV